MLTKQISRLLSIELRKLTDHDLIISTLKRLTLRTGTAFSGKSVEKLEPVVVDYLWCIYVLKAISKSIRFPFM